MTVTTPKLTGDRFDDARILIVEDEPFIAWDLAQAVESAGGIVIGPAATVVQALALVQASVLEAAILDVNLPDGHIGPVLETLRPHVASSSIAGWACPRKLGNVSPVFRFTLSPRRPGC